MRYNHNRSIIATSGVEKVVKLWSVLPFPTTKANATGNDSFESQRGERRVFSHEEYIGLVMRSSVMTHDYSAGNFGLGIFGMEILTVTPTRINQPMEPH